MRRLLLISMLLALVAPLAARAQTTYFCNGLAATIVGTDTDASHPNGDDAIDDVLSGTPGDDVIVARGGDDYVGGGDGNDTICSGDGVDDVFGDPGNDWIDSGGANDSVEGNAGADYMKLGGTTLPYNGPPEFLPPNGGSLARGNIFCSDCLHAGGSAGPDEVVGGPGRDLGGLEAGSDVFYGFAGRDSVGGGDGNDFLYGGTGTDSAHAGAGKDTCRGFESKISCEL